MPLQINEIGIRMRVQEQDGGDADISERPTDEAKVSLAEREELVAECTRRVLGILDEMRSR